MKSWKSSFYICMILIVALCMRSSSIAMLVPEAEVAFRARNDGGSVPHLSHHIREPSINKATSTQEIQATKPMVTTDDLDELRTEGSLPNYKHEAGDLRGMVPKETSTMPDQDDSHTQAEYELWMRASRERDSSHAIVM